MPDLSDKVSDERLRELAAGGKTSDCGHGHVWPNANGMKARCGGPGLCAQCSIDKVAKDNAATGENARIAAELLALRTRPAASTMEGWRFMPEEPTEAMLEAAEFEQINPTPRRYKNALDRAFHIYRAMLATAPIPPEVMK